MKFGKILILAAVLSLGLFPAVQGAKAAESANSQLREALGQDALTFPVVTMKDWKESSPESRMSFLVGFVTVVQMEKLWQGKAPLPLEDSLNSSWVKGLDGIPLTDIYAHINTYADENPTELDLPVVEYMWYAYVQPVVTEKVSAQKLEELEIPLADRKVPDITPAR